MTLTANHKVSFSNKPSTCLDPVELSLQSSVIHLPEFATSHWPTVCKTQREKYLTLGSYRLGLKEMKTHLLAW